MSDLRGGLPPDEPPPVPPTEDVPRRWWQRRGLRWSVLGLLIVLIATPLLLVGLMSSAIERIPRADMPSLADQGGPRVFLLVGSDSRDDLPEDLEGKFGDFSGRRADVVILAQLGGDGARLISLPRDLRVTIPGSGTNRINAAYAIGGPDLLVETVTSNTGIAVHHYVEVGFGGFARLVDSVGGIELEFPYPTRDLKSGLDVTAGTQTVDGATALAYARSRNYQELQNGTWTPVDTGDINRTKRQQEVMSKVIAKGSNVVRFWQIPGFVRAVGRSITADAGMSYGRLLQMAFSLLGTSSGDVESVTLPVREQTGADGRSYVVGIEPEASAVLEAFKTGDDLEE